MASEIVNLSKIKASLLLTLTSVHPFQLHPLFPLVWYRYLLYWVLLTATWDTLVFNQKISCIILNFIFFSNQILALITIIMQIVWMSLWEMINRRWLGHLWVSFGLVYLVDFSWCCSLWLFWVDLLNGLSKMWVVLEIGRQLLRDQYFS